MTALQALQTHSVAFFYRTPSFPEVLRMIDEAKELGIPTFWEVDDLIFDAEKYATNANLKDLTAVRDAASAIGCRRVPQGNGSL